MLYQLLSSFIPSYQCILTKREIILLQIQLSLAALNHRADVFQTVTFQIQLQSKYIDLNQPHEQQISVHSCINLAFFCDLLISVFYV